MLFVCVLANVLFIAVISAFIATGEGNAAVKIGVIEFAYVEVFQVWGK